MRLLWLVPGLLIAACADEIPENVSAEMEAARLEREGDGNTPPDPTELLRTAPAGGHADWIRDIRLGLDTIPALAAVDRGEAQYAVQELYARRFDVLQQFYGPEGAVAVDATVTGAVERAGVQLQQLIRHLAGGADVLVIEESVRTSQDALVDIESATRAAGLPPAAPRDASLP